MNKYNSYIRTYTARNLLWDGSALQGAAPRGLHALNPPNDVIIDQSSVNLYELDLVTGIFDTTDSGHEGWKPQSNLSIRRVGLYSNFADGLVFENIEGRMGLTINANLFKITAKTGSIVFTKGSNLVTGTGLIAAFPLGFGYVVNGLSISVPPLFYARNVHMLYVIDDTNARISDYAFTTRNMALINTLDVVGSNIFFTLTSVPSLNCMYETDIFFPVSNTVSGYNVFLSATPYIDSIDSTFNLKTISIDTGYVDVNISLDAIVEAEITPF